MAFARRIQNPEGLYFITFATVQWADVFTRSTYVDIVLESLRYCQKEKGLRIHAWCIMNCVKKQSTRQLLFCERNFASLKVILKYSIVFDDSESLSNQFVGNSHFSGFFGFPFSQ